MPITKRALRSCLVVAATAFAVVVPGGLPFFAEHAAFAQAADAAEKDAFEAAKDLGTADAWSAFLANYPTGFRADLARAYMKQVGTASPAPPAAGVAAQSPAPAADEFPVEAGTWGGVVRSGPGQSFSKQASLKEGETVALMGVADELDNGFPWFKIWYGPEQRKGYMWGGILCAKGKARQDVFQMCPAGRGSALQNSGGSRVSPGFDCTRPSNDAERTICGNDSLASMDQELNSEYQLTISNITSEAVGGTEADVAAFRREQSDWIRRRNACGSDVTCLRKAYQSRIATLRDHNQPE